ncbi:MAG: CBS domain-containing protein, partial [Magnetococcales bacterium]|nr:CBS domain-containing protein [Magnetococcales bacterium]
AGKGAAAGAGKGGVKGMAGGGSDEGELTFLDPYQEDETSRVVMDAVLDDDGVNTTRGGRSPGGKSGGKASIAMGEVFGPLPQIQYAKDSLPTPGDKGSVKSLITEFPFTLRDDERVIVAIMAMRQDGYRYIGIDKGGKLMRVVSYSDLRQIMGPFFGTKAMTQRDKALCSLPLGKINATQKTVTISLEGSIAEAADLIMEHRLHALPVVSHHGVLRGFVTLHGLLDYYRRKKQM